MLEDRVLLVDDEEQFVFALSKRLGARGLSVTTAENGEVALARLTERKYDAIVLDLAMPGMDGLETLRRILLIDPDAQVILLTGHGSIQAATEAMKRGAADFLEKPADFNDLMSKLRDCFARRLALGQQHTERQIADLLRNRGW